MNLFRREPIVATCCVILALATAEGWVAWRYLANLKAESKAERISLLERELATKTDETNHLIFLRDAERRRMRSSQPPLTADEELAEASAHAFAHPEIAGRRGERARPLTRNTHSPSAMPGIPGFPVPTDDEGDVMDTPQGAHPTEFTPADIDPKQLVNMANIMTGKKVAELTRMKGTTMIRYMVASLGEDDPIWHLLDAINQAHALKEVLLVGQTREDATRLQKTMKTLIESGVPSRLIHVKTGDQDYQGLDGILINLVRRRT